MPPPVQETWQAADNKMAGDLSSVGTMCTFSLPEERPNSTSVACFQIPSAEYMQHYLSGLKWDPKQWGVGNTTSPETQSLILLPGKCDSGS